MAEFDYLKNNLPFVPPEQLEPDIKENETINRVMEEVSVKRAAKEELREEETRLRKQQKIELESREDVKGFVKWCIENKVYQH